MRLRIFILVVSVNECIKYSSTRIKKDRRRNSTSPNPRAHTTTIPISTRPHTLLDFSISASITALIKNTPPPPSYAHIIFLLPTFIFQIIPKTNLQKAAKSLSSITPLTLYYLLSTSLSSSDMENQNKHYHNSNLDNNTTNSFLTFLTRESGSNKCNKRRLPLFFTLSKCLLDTTIVSTLHLRCN